MTLRTGSPAKPSNEVLTKAVQKRRVLAKARNEVFNVLGQTDVAIRTDTRQVRRRPAGFLHHRRPHRVGVDVVPHQLLARRPFRGDASGRMNAVRGLSVRRQQADRRYRVRDQFPRGLVGLRFRPRSIGSRCAGLKEGFDIDRHRMVAGGDHVLVMNIAGHKAVEEREPCPGSTEEPLAALLRLAPGVVDELGPSVAVTRNTFGSAEFNGRIAVEPLDERLPRDIESQIAWFVHDA